MMIGSAFRAELAEQTRAAAAATVAAEIAGDELLAEAMRIRLEDLDVIAARHEGSTRQ